MVDGLWESLQSAVFSGQVGKSETLQKTGLIKTKDKSEGEK